MEAYCKSWVQRIFDKYDRDQNGILNKQELKAFLKDEMDLRPLNKKNSQR